MRTKSADLNCPYLCVLALMPSPQSLQSECNGGTNQCSKCLDCELRQKRTSQCVIDCFNKEV
jgi:hypothetical protein